MVCEIFATYGGRYSAKFKYIGAIRWAAISVMKEEYYTAILHTAIS
jgi:hypothetical protein